MIYYVYWCIYLYILCLLGYIPVFYFVLIDRVGEGVAPLAIVVYIDGSFVKHKIPVKPIYVTVRNLNSVVSGKACAWRVLGMLPSLRKSATLAQTDTWRKDRRLRLHHACISHLVQMINKFGSEDKHLLCADGQVQHAIYCVQTGIYCVQTGIYQYILSIYPDSLFSGATFPCLSGFPEHGWFCRQNR